MDKWKHRSGAGGMPPGCAVLHAWLAVFVAAGCGGPTFVNGVYEDGHARYQVGVLSPAWRRVRVDDNDLAFHHPALGTISVNSTCTEYEDVTATALLNQLLFDTTERRFVIEEDVTLDGRGARHVVVQLQLDGVPLELEVYLLKKDGCVFDLTHIRRQGASPAARQAFARVVRGFAVIGVRLDG